MFDAFGSQNPELVARTEGLKRYLLQMQPIPHFVEPTTHRFLLARYLVAELVEFFPLMQKQQKLSYLSSGTSLIIMEKSLVSYS